MDSGTALLGCRDERPPIYSPFATPFQSGLLRLEHAPGISGGARLGRTRCRGAPKPCTARPFRGSPRSVYRCPSFGETLSALRPNADEAPAHFVSLDPTTSYRSSADQYATPRPPVALLGLSSFLRVARVDDLPQRRVFLVTPRLRAARRAAVPLSEKLVPKVELAARAAGVDLSDRTLRRLAKSNHLRGTLRTGRLRIVRWRLIGWDPPCRMEFAGRPCRPLPLQPISVLDFALFPLRFR